MTTRWPRAGAFLSMRHLVQTLEVEVPVDDDELIVRIEIFEDLSAPGNYISRIWRLEHYRLQSTFPQNAGVPVHSPSDELILKRFEGFESSLVSPAQFTDANAAAQQVLKELSEWAMDLRPAQRNT